jgi:hypothetical protein
MYTNTGIAEELKKQGVCADSSWKQCRTKYKHLKAQYKKHKDSTNLLTS